MQGPALDTHAAAAAPAALKASDGELQRLTAALTTVLSTGLASNFVEGLKPVLHNGKVVISTYIRLPDDPEPVFIGMYPSLPAAVAGQKQSMELVGHLPPAVARKLIGSQMAHTDPSTHEQHCQAGAGGQQQQGQGGPERWQSNTASESTAMVAHGSSWQAADGDGTPKAHRSTQQQQEPGSAEIKHEPASSSDRHGGSTPQGSRDSGAAAGAASPQGGRRPTTPSAGVGPSAIAAAVAAAASPRQQQPSALTDDVIRMLLHRGLHAITEAQHHQHDEQQQQQQWQQQQQPQPQEDQQSLLDMFNTPTSTPGSHTGLAHALQQLPSPQQHQLLLQQRQQQQEQQQQLQHMGSGGPALDARLFTRPQQQYAGGYGGHGVGGPAAAAAVLSGGMGQAVDDALNEAMLRGQGAPASAAPFYSSPLGLPYSQGPAAFGAGPGFDAGAVADPGMHLAHLSSFQQQQQQAAAAAMGFGGGPHRPELGGPGSQALAAFTAAAGGGDFSLGAAYGAGGFGMQQQQYGAGGLQAINAAAAAAAAAEGADVSDYEADIETSRSHASGGSKRKRGQADARLNCVKSVQYRVSRFPPELHDLCIEHWERARCARVVCNQVQGVMSVQNGRCVVSFHQDGEEVVKGVADFLRYSGEERIKKWRRHVRLVDFPRPGNRSGELMTAEEFLCIVGYQSEQGGGRKPRGAE